MYYLNSFFLANKYKKVASNAVYTVVKEFAAQYKTVPREILGYLLR